MSLLRNRLKTVVSALVIGCLVLPTAQVKADEIVSGGAVTDTQIESHGGSFYEDHEYRVYNDVKTWTEAQEFCEQMGGHLVTINSQEESDFIVQLVESEESIKNNYWIGLKRNDIGSVWQWVTGEPVEYTNWAPNEPNNNKSKGEYYVHMFGVKYTKGNGIKMPGNWNDATDNGADFAGVFYAIENYGFICEWGDDVVENDEINKGIDQVDDEDLSRAKFGLLQAKIEETTSTTLNLTWNPISSADGYLIYGNYCGKKYEFIKDIEDRDIGSCMMEGLDSGTYYKYFVVAYKNNGEDKDIVGISKTIHSTTDDGEYGNAKSVKLSKIKGQKKVGVAVLKKGKTAKISAKSIPVDKKINQHRKLAYESSNSKVATVSSNGVIKAKKKGKCTIYVYAQNGVSNKIQVTIK